MSICPSCKAGNHWCVGNCECFCDAPDSYWSPDSDQCECCEYDPGVYDVPSIVTVELPGVSR